MLTHATIGAAADDYEAWAAIDNASPKAADAYAAMGPLLAAA